MNEKKVTRLAPSITISDCPSEVFCTKFSPDGQLLAAGCGDGAIRLFDTNSGKLSYTLMQPQHNYGFGMPCTAIRFRPMSSSAKTKNVLLAVNSNGAVEHWHITSGKCLHAITDEQNQLYALDYRSDGGMFAAAGKDHTVRVYDEATKTQVVAMSGGHGTITAGHSNRVFSIKWMPNDENVLLSGGWDNTIQIWDVRVQHSVRSIYGPHIAGDALDIQGEEILTGSWRADNPLELWDYGTGKRTSVIPWKQSTLKNEPCFLYAAQFTKNAQHGLIAAGGSGANEAKVFDHKHQDRLVGTITGLSRGVFTLDFSPDGNKLCVAGADATIRLIDVYEADASLDAIRDRPSTPSIKNAPSIHEASNVRVGSPTIKGPPSPSRVMSIH